MSHAPHRRPARAGVTLIEIVMVLALVGIVAAIALPRIDVEHYRIDGAARAVGTTLLMAQRSAVTSQHDVVVTFDVTHNALRIHDDLDNDHTVNGTERVRQQPLGDLIVYGRASAPAMPIGAGPVTFTKQVSGVPAVVFHRDGSASEAGGFYLTSRRSLNSTHPEDARAIQVERGTGRVSWYRYRSNTWQRGF